MRCTSWCATLLIASLIASAPARAVPCSELPVLFLVQDKSGSMAKAPDGSEATFGNPSKWSTAQQAVPALAAQFSNRFRFGAAMYPGATTTFNCTTGSVVAPVSGSPSGVQSAYASAVPGGGTPTASSLQQAKNYLLGLGLTTPAYVLLITDGLPNCNLGLNPNFCTATTPGCGSDACGLGAKDCLDDSSSVQAAQQLWAAGIPVFVVGFDSTFTAGNNKAVLDAIAQAGGTSGAAVVTNQAQLTQTLNAIALNTATCCQDACTVGAAQCVGGGQRKVCQYDASIGCTTWVTQSCPSMATCQGGQCTSCQSVCTPGARRCSGDSAQTCQTGSGGCAEWVTTEECSYGSVCSGGSCGTCQSCTLGSSRCTAGGVETCEWNVFSGCTSWMAGTCPSGSVCQGGSCSSCNQACTAGTTRCSGNTVETCAADGAGCTAWQPSQTCTNFCSGGACGACGTSCTPGAARCQGQGVETCLIDANNCPAWGPAQQCGPNSYCTGSGACTQCGPGCPQGARRCGAGGTTEVCQLDTNGCTGFVVNGQCAAGEGCELGTCIPACQDACVEGSARCEAGGPQACQRVGTGCTTWAAQPACAADRLCSEGVCLVRCTGGEFEDCPAGLVCTGIAAGTVCLPGSAPDAGTPPSGSDAGTVDAGTQTGDKDPGNGLLLQGMGCGCFGGGGGAWPLAALALVGRLARRRRARL